MKPNEVAARADGASHHLPPVDPAAAERPSGSSSRITRAASGPDAEAPAGYRSRPLKRARRSRSEIGALDDGIVAAIELDAPATLRGVFYRVVSLGGCEKSEQDYRAVGRRLLALRRDGTVDYADITDGTRLMRKPKSWRGVEDVLCETARVYRRDLWADSGTEVIVLSEKDAITGVIYPVTSEWDVELGIVRGYSSETFVASVADTVTANTADGRHTVIYQLGDYDPSGVDAWRAFQERLRIMVSDERLLHMHRLAVRREQIEAYGLPTRPTKPTDSRAGKFADLSVEVDAIPASELRAIVDEAIERHADPEKLRVLRIAEESERKVLTQIAGQAGRWSR